MKKILITLCLPFVCILATTTIEKTKNQIEFEKFLQKEFKVEFRTIDKLSKEGKNKSLLDSIYFNYSSKISKRR